MNPAAAPLLTFRRVPHPQPSEGAGFASALLLRAPQRSLRLCVIFFPALLRNRNQQPPGYPDRLLVPPREAAFVRRLQIPPEPMLPRRPEHEVPDSLAAHRVTLHSKLIRVIPL